MGVAGQLAAIREHLAKVREESQMFGRKQESETARIWFRRVQFQTPNLLSFFRPHRVPGGSSVSSSQPTTIGPKMITHTFLLFGN